MKTRLTDLALIALILAASALPFHAADPPNESPSQDVAAPVQQLLDRANEHLKGDDLSQFLEAIEQALNKAKELDDERGYARALAVQAQALQNAGKFDEAKAAWAEAQQACAVAGDGPGRVRALYSQAYLMAEEEPDEAGTLLDQAIAFAASEERHPADAVAVLREAAFQFWRRHLVDHTEKLLRSALAIEEQRGDQEGQAMTLMNLAVVSNSRGDPDRATEYYQQSMTIAQKIAPRSRLMARLLNNLGLLALDKGDFVTSEQYLLRSLAVKKEVDPDSQGNTLINLGLLKQEQGALVVSIDYLQEALKLLPPDSVGTGRALNNLGNVAVLQGDYEAARSYYSRALEIKERKAPGSADVASTIDNLGWLSDFEGDLDAAAEFHKRAYAIKERVAANTLTLAASLNGLGNNAKKRGDLDAAAEYHRRALEIQRKYGPTKTVYSLVSLGQVEAERGEYDSARAFYQRAHKLVLGSAPGSTSEVVILHNLGILEEAAGDLPSADSYLSRAWTIAQRQADVIFGDEARQAYGSSTAEFVEDLLRVELAQGKAMDALRTLEEGRAQALLQLLSERGLRDRCDSPQWERLREADTEVKYVGGRLAEARWNESKAQDALSRVEDDGTDAEVDAAVRALSSARAHGEQLVVKYVAARQNLAGVLSELRRAVPGLEPRRHDFDSSLNRIPSSAVFVSFAVGKEETAVFVIAPQHEVRVHGYTVSLGRREVAEKVAALVGALRQTSGLRGLRLDKDPGPTQDFDTVVTAASRLYRTLFPDKAHRVLSEAKSLILSPDGPLWELPFSLLVVEEDGSLDWLGLTKPMSYVPSMSVFAIERTGPRSSSIDLEKALVVGDPMWEPPAASVPRGQEEADRANSALDVPHVSSQGERRALFADGRPPTALVGARDEAKRVAALYGAKALLGSNATELAVRRRIPDAPVIHLATHGYFYSGLAMNSGVLLAAPSSEVTSKATDDDGALQAWEFGRTLQLNAEVVVLSACETGRGKEVRGEGLVGLTRSLLGAGARSIVGTLWKIDDESTSDLMVSFHENMLAGLRKDEALKRAMTKTAEDSSASHPYFWGAFLLIGDTAALPTASAD